VQGVGQGGVGGRGGGGFDGWVVSGGCGA
jgi:hypothetical protein